MLIYPQALEDEGKIKGHVYLVCKFNRLNCHNKHIKQINLYKID